MWEFKNQYLYCCTCIPIRLRSNSWVRGFGKKNPILLEKANNKSIIIPGIPFIFYHDTTTYIFHTNNEHVPYVKFK